MPRNGNGRLPHGMTYKLVEVLSAKGLTEQEIAEVFDVTPQAWDKLIKENERLVIAVRDGRKTPVKQIEAALFRRAVGFAYQEVEKSIRRMSDGEELEVDRKIKEKHFLGSDTAAIFLLKNWDPEHYKEEFHVGMSLRDRMLRGTVMEKKRQAAEQTDTDEMGTNEA